MTPGMEAEAQQRFRDGTQIGKETDLVHHFAAAVAHTCGASADWRDRTGSASEVAIRVATAKLHLDRASELLAIHYGD